MRRQSNVVITVARNLLHSISQWEKKDLLLVIPVVLWLLCFSVSAHFPHEYRPEIFVTLLPDWEKTLFGIPFVYQLFPTSPIITLLSCLPYLLHFSLPWIFAIYLWRVEGKGMAFLFLWVIGVLNCMSLMIQFVIPTAPPWYIQKYGTVPANYDIPSEPGRLTDIDELFGISLFKGMYGTNPVVFGSFPSLHAAWPFTIAFFSTDKVLGKWKWIYVAWVWWAAIYLIHHYIVDIIGGVFLSLLALSWAKPSYEEEESKTTRHRLVLCV
jgi:inositol phosphorylceramide synthase catalytic subunit